MDSLTGKLWHHLSAEKATEALQTDPQKGLDTFEVQRRAVEFGPNALTGRRGKTPLERFLLQFHQPLIYVLLLSGLITAVLGEVVDSSVIIGVVLVNAIVGYIQEAKAAGALEALARSMVAEAEVVRSGGVRRIGAVDLVPGDVVLLRSGDKVPADLRLVTVKDLRVDESALTGESVPVSKAVGTLPRETVLADRTNMAYASALVTYGTATGVVVATGDHTEIGRISTMVHEADTLATPLTRRIEKFSHLLLWAIMALAVLTFVAGVARGEKAAEMFMARRKKRGSHERPPPTHGRRRPRQYVKTHAGLLQCTPGPKLLVRLDNAIGEDRDTKDTQPCPQSYGGATEQPVHDRHIGERHLQDDHARRPEQRPRVAHDTKLEGRPGERPAIEQIEGLHQNEHVHRNGTCRLLRVPLRQFELVESEGRHQKQRAHKNDAPEELTVENGVRRVARLALHEARFHGLKGQHDAQDAGGCHIDPQYLHGKDGQCHAKQHRHQNDQPFAKVGRQRPHDELEQVVVHAAPLFDGSLDGREIVVGEHHVRSFLGGLCPSVPHGNADVRLLECGGVVDAVPRHGDDLAPALQRHDQSQLLFRRDTREDGCLSGMTHQFIVGQSRKLRTREHLAGGVAGASGIAKADLLADGGGCHGMVACYHLDLHARTMECGDSRHRLGPGRVDHALQPDHDKSGRDIIMCQMRHTHTVHALGQRKHTQSLHRHAFDLFAKCRDIKRNERAIVQQHPVCA